MQPNIILDMSNRVYVYVGRHDILADVRVDMYLAQSVMLTICEWMPNRTSVRFCGHVY